ncbi:hypothetical protein GCM10014713_45140 [Streptomyces purpureus]|uniref:Uncharacterized protein n=1 Tax=Streptomyces purpureus TaxID=1951 RepID=A0A918HAL0_9ACTN|nr:hypothetical protein GCM10014713_45140 [Streptomyces purpureus]
MCLVVGLVGLVGLRPSVQGSSVEAGQRAPGHLAGVVRRETQHAQHHLGQVGGSLVTVEVWAREPQLHQGQQGAAQGGQGDGRIDGGEAAGGYAHLGPGTGYVHSAYQVTDLDALAAGGEYLAERGYRRSWGIGRHIQGSQLFDYWRDADHFMLEHFADGDRFSCDIEPGWAPMSASGLAQWGPPVTRDFLGAAPRPPGSARSWRRCAATTNSTRPASWA